MLNFIKISLVKFSYKIFDNFYYFLFNPITFYTTVTAFIVRISFSIADITNILYSSAIKCTLTNIIATAFTAFNFT